MIYADLETFEDIKKKQGKKFHTTAPSGFPYVTYVVSDNVIYRNVCEEGTIQPDDEWLTDSEEVIKIGMQ